MAEYKIKGHEKFSLREGWLTKGMEAVKEPSKVFSSDNGPDVLGVGSNMVKSIKYWLQAFKLINEDSKKGSELSDLGKIIYKYDKFIEDAFTVWLLQSQIAHNKTKATSWYLFFNYCEAEEFKKEELLEVLKKELISYAETDSFPESSLKDDIDVLLNMYSKTNENDDPEDKNICPLASLGLVRRDKDTYVCKQPDLRYLNNKVILYEVYGLLGDNTSVSIDAVSNLTKKIFHLSRVSTNNYLDTLDNANLIKVVRTAGLDVIYPVVEMTQLQIVEEYYQNR